MVWQAVISGVCAIVIWSLAPAIVKVGSIGTHLSEFIIARYLIAALFLFPWITRVWQKRKDVSVRSWTGIMLYINAHIFLQAYCLQLVSVSWYVIIFSLSPFLTLLMMGTPLNRMRKLSIFTSGLGALCFINPAEIMAFPSWPVLVATVGTMVSWSLVTVKLLDFQKSYRDIEISAIMNYFVLVGATVFWLLNSRSFATLSSMTLSWTAVLAIAMPLGFVLFSFCLREMPFFGIASQYLELVVGLMIGVFIFSDDFNLIKLFGSCLVITGLIMLSLPNKKVMGLSY